jgi:hypothetical protein
MFSRPVTFALFFRAKGFLAVADSSRRSRCGEGGCGEGGFHGGQSGRGAVICHGNERVAWQISEQNERIPVSPYAFRLNRTIKQLDRNPNNESQF